MNGIWRRIFRWINGYAAFAYNKRHPNAKGYKRHATTNGKTNNKPIFMKIVNVGNS